MHTPIPGIHDAIRFDDPLWDQVDPIVRHAHRLVNQATHGRLEVDYDARKITLTDISGDAAMRFHAIVSDYRTGDPSSARWSDQHHPETADAAGGLLTFDIARVLCVRWVPERFLQGPKPGRKLLSASLKVLTAHTNNPDVDAWDQDAAVAYLTVGLDAASGRVPAGGSSDEGDEGIADDEADDADPAELDDLDDDDGSADISPDPAE